VAGLRGESSRKRKDEHDESDEEEEKEAVRREEAVLVAGNEVSHSFGTFWARSLRVAEEPMASEKERRDTLCVVSYSSTSIIFFLINFATRILYIQRGKRRSLAICCLMPSFFKHKIFGDNTIHKQKTTLQH
jgi:hypothetical protein